MAAQDDREAPDPSVDPTTDELRLEQFRREKSEHERAEGALDEEEAGQHERRAQKASYLRRKLEERARAEREAGRPDKGE